MRFIPLSELNGGEILAQNIVNSNQQVLMREGSKLSIKFINRIGQYGIKSVYIRDPDVEPFLEGRIKDTITPEIRQNSISSVKISFLKFEMNIKKQKTVAKYGDSGSVLFTGIKNVSSDLIDEILNSKDTDIAMIDIKKSADYNYEHSVNVAVLSLIIGVEMGLSITDLENLAYGALMIDIGYNWVDSKILNKEGKLTDTEMIEVKKHINLGYEYITNNTTFNAHVKSIVFQHHERVNGSGYPKGLMGGDIHKLAKIVMIADIYDAMTSDRAHRNAFPPHEVIEYIMANAGTLFDYEIASIFARKVIPYPIGTYVLLSNKQKGVILQNNKNHPLRPKIRTFGKSSYTGGNKLVIDLIEENNIVIEKVVYKLS